MSEKKYDNAELAIELKNILNSQQLKTIYTLYFQKFDSTQKSKYAVPKSLSDIYQARVIINTLVDEVLCNKFLDSLEEAIKTILLNLSWKDNFINNIEIKNQYGIDVIIKRDKYVSFLNFLEKIDERFYIFNIDQNYDSDTHEYIFTFSLPSIIKKLICESLIEKPKEFNLLPVENINDTKYFYNNNDEILKDLGNYITFLENKPEYLKYNFFETPKILKNDLKFLSNISNLKKEFFDFKDAEFIKTNILSIFITSFIKENSYEKLNNLMILKEIILKCEKEPFFIFYNLIFNLNDKKNINIDDNNTILKNKDFIGSMFFVFREMKEDKYYSFNDILSFIRLRSLNIYILDKIDIQKFYISYKNEYDKKAKKYFSAKYDIDILTIIPLIKSVFFLFSSLGLFEIKYNKPNNDLYSIFEGLSYVKLTKLGSYLLGLNNNFEFKTQEENKTKIIINNTDLTILIKGNDKTKSLFIASFSEKISNNMYIVNNLAFLKNCHSKKDIEEKIKLFKKEVSLNPPEIWNKFFYKILNNSILIKRDDELIVYNLPNNKDLIDILFKDDLINSLIKKVEGQKIAIYKDDFIKIKKRLEIFGFLLEN